MARRSSQQSVSLFPFLAVLVCTMGALILLLLVTTRRMRQEQARYTAAVEVLDDLTNGDLIDATAVSVDNFVVAATQPNALATDSAAAPPSASEQLASEQLLQDDLDVPEFQEQWFPEVDDSAERLNELQEQVAAAVAKQENLKQQKKDLEERLSGQKLELAAVKVQIEEADIELLTTGREVRKLEDVEVTLLALKSEKDDLELQILQQKKLLAGVQAELEEKSLFTEEAEAVLTTRESALVSLRRLVVKSSENLAKDSSATQLEFTNTEGTARIPIVINVDEKGFTFQPSGITVTPKDLKGFPANDNPLLAGIQATAAHRSEGLLPNDPYVLLLVRPSGSLGFYQAQQAMTVANIHFGYELLEADRTVEMGDSNADEVKLVRQSILEALNRRSTLYGALVAAQQERAERSGENDSQRRRTAGAGNGSPGGSDRSGRSGAAERSLQEQLGLGRVYAGGEAKPAPDVSRYQNRNLRARPTPQPGNQIAQAQPPLRQPDASSGFNADYSKPPGSGNESQPLQNAQVVDMPSLALGNGGSGPAGQAGDSGKTTADFADALRTDRSSELSKNMGLNGELAAAEMPNATVAQQRNGVPFVDVHSAGDQISPDVDWPSVEAAPQPEGTRPVDTELLSKFESAAAGQPQTAEQFESSDEDFAQSESDQPDFAFGSSAGSRTSHGQQDFSPTVRPTADQLAAVANVPQDQRLTTNEAVPLVNGQVASNAFGSGGTEGQGVGNGPPAESESSYLQRFLDEVEEQRSKEVPNTVLLRLLRRSQNSIQGQMSDNLSSPGQNQPTETRFPESRRKSVSQTQPPANPTSEVAKPERVSRPVYYVVRIYVSDSKLIVGSFEPMNVAGWSDKQIADAAFRGVSETMKGVWAKVREDALPAVRFLTAEGSEDRTALTSRHLQGLNIPTRAMQLEGRDFSLYQFFSDNLPPTSQSSSATSRATGVTAKPTESAKQPNRSEQQPATSSGRRISI